MFSWISEFVSKWKGGIAMSENYKDDILEDSYYLISLFSRDNKEVTNLQIQKLMYFFEAYYMVEKDVDYLYECPFKAWTWGPVAIPLYKKYKNLGNAKIILTEEEKKLGNAINSEKKRMIEEIYNVFGKKLSAIQLVNYTHMQDSPWYNTWIKNDKRVIYGDESNIDKIETKKWFREKFIKVDD